MAIELQRFERLFINGEWVAPIDGEIVDTIDPATGRPWARVAFGGKKDVDLAVAAAKAAMRGPWAKLPGYERAALLRKVAEIVQKRAPELTVLESRDSGRIIREARAELSMHHQWYYWAASLADKIDGRTIPTESHIHAFTTRVPVGVVGAITPWNVPLMMAAWKVGPALAAGCALILKPAESTSITSLELANIMHEAGIPPGVFNVVPGYGTIAGAALVAHPDVAKISFTGEGRTAVEIIKAGAETLKRVTFELGGKSPHIIFDDAAVDQAINAATASAFVLCGQSCALGSRLLVQRSIYGRVAEEIARRAQAIRVGMPLDDQTQMGPQANESQLNKTLRYLQIGQDQGAKLLAGGHRITDGDLRHGFFVEPTVFGEVSNNMRIAREEIFGPVMSIIPFDTEEEAVVIANDTRYGLTAGLWTSDTGRAHRVASQIEAGTVWVNTYRYVRWSLPYGGFKMSGLGRENGIEVLDNFLETRTTIINFIGQFPDAYAH
jgi:aldehyde dehydrogenase (NAD+)